MKRSCKGSSLFFSLLRLRNGEPSWSTPSSGKIVKRWPVRGYKKIGDHSPSASCIFSWDNQGILWYGMEGKEKSVWNTEWLKYGMEDLMYGMERIFHIPYKFHTCTFWHGVAEVRSFFQLNILANKSLSSTRTVIRKLRAFFLISVTNSNVDAKKGGHLFWFCSHGNRGHCGQTSACLLPCCQPGIV